MRAWRTALTVRHVAAIVSALVFGSAGEQRRSGPARQGNSRLARRTSWVVPPRWESLCCWPSRRSHPRMSSPRPRTTPSSTRSRATSRPGIPQLGPPREHHPRLQRLRPPGRARSQNRQGGPEPRGVVEGHRRHDLGGQAPQGREVPRRHAVRRQGRQGHLRPRAEPREQAHGPRQPRQDQERRGGGRPRPCGSRRTGPTRSSSSGSPPR